MEAVPASVWLQYPVVLIVLVAVLILLKEFKTFIKERDDQWQAFLTRQRSEDQETIRDLVTQVKALTQELINLRSDFERAVATMKERTRTRVNNKVSE